MAKTAKKIVFSRSRDIPFNKLVISDANVRQIRPDANVEELSQDIDRREDLIQGLNVRPILDADGNETGMFEVPAGGRRYRAIERLVKAKRFPRNGLVPCIVRKTDTPILREDDSLAENVQRTCLHPLDLFRAFKSMIDQDMTRAEVAAAFFTTEKFVAQRLRLACVSPVLLDVYAEDGMTLEMLEAFTVNPDHARQEQVWEALQNSHFRQPWYIRQQLTETTVPADDKRARFVGIDAYEQAGGVVLRDLFTEHEKGWLTDIPLLDSMVAEKLKAAAEEIAGEGWKWISADVELPYGYENGLRGLTGAIVDLSEEERTEREALRDEYERLETEYAEAEELPEEIDQRLGEIESALEAFERRPVTYDPADIARAGVFVSIDREGELFVDRGYVRPEDEASEAEDTGDGGVGADGDDDGGETPRTIITVGGQSGEPDDDDEEAGAVKPLPERLVIELTAHRTLALRDALAANPHVATTALLHRLVLDSFGHRAGGASIEATVRTVQLPIQATDLGDSPSAQAVDERHDAWKADIPLGDDDDALWTWLDRLDEGRRQALLAHCVSFGVNALYERPNPYSGYGVSQHGLDTRLREADRLSRVTGLDMVEAGWRPTVANYLGRVTKNRILEAVREGVGDHAAELIGHLKKGEMAKEAERLLADSGWLPEPLRTADLDGQEPAEPLPAFLATDSAPEQVADEAESAAIAAE